MENDLELTTVDNANVARSHVLKDVYLLRLVFQHMNVEDSDELEQDFDESEQHLYESEQDLYESEDTDESEIYSDNSSLFHTSLACKAFLEPALDMLWESLDSLLPLLKLLPSFTLVDGQYTLTGQISDSDWARFDAYARRIRTLSYNASELPLTTYLYPRLLQCHPSPILPALRRVKFSSEDCPDCDFAGLFMLISPSLSFLDFKILAQDRGPIEAFFSSLATAETLLKKVSYKGYASTNILMNLPRFQRLESLSLCIRDSQVSSEFFSMLNTLEHLTTLKIDVTGSTLNAFPPLDIGEKRRHNGLASLKSLYIKGLPTHLALILSAIAVNHLESVTIYFAHESTFEECSATLAICFNYLSLSDSLRDVSITHCPWSFHSSSCDLKFSLLSSLWRSHSLLRTLRVKHAKLSTQLDDLKWLAMSSPNLEVLQLEADNRVAFTSLSIFAQFCRGLQMLQLPLDSAAPPVELENNQSEHQLETLLISGGSDGFEGVDASRYIDRLFPYLKIFQEDCTGEDWNQIRRLIKVYQDVRRGAIGSRESSQG